MEDAAKKAPPSSCEAVDLISVDFIVTYGTHRNDLFFSQLYSCLLLESISLCNFRYVKSMYSRLLEYSRTQIEFTDSSETFCPLFFF